jgi:hypothetical protein
VFYGVFTLSVPEGEPDLEGVRARVRAREGGGRTGHGRAGREGEGMGWDGMGDEGGGWCVCVGVDVVGGCRGLRQNRCGYSDRW